MSFQNKTILITGGTRGIGKAIGLRLAKEGANIVIAAKRSRSAAKSRGIGAKAATAVATVGRDA